MFKDIFYQNPLLRLAIPLILGIAVGWVCNIGLLHILFLLVLALATLLSGLMRSAPKWLFGLGAIFFMFSVGILVENRQADGKAPLWNQKKGFYTASLVEMPVVRGTSVKVLANLVSEEDSIPPYARRQGLVYLYFPRTVDTETLSAGDVVAFEAVVSQPANQGNPAEFDVEGYYYIKDVSGTAFVPDSKWQMLPVKENSLQTEALRLRSKAISLYERLGFEGDELSLLSALTLGEKRDFPQELKEDFAVAGASHILALSGLHLGVLYLLLTFLFPLRRRRISLRILRELLIVAFLWGFAFVAGLSPSVVRSATLFTLMSFGRLMDYDVSSISSLSFAAIVMLLFSPHLLFDISFQLSFAAVFAILLLLPSLQELTGVHRRGVVYGYVVNLLLISFVAQVGTMPFVWYYFGVFPVYFLITNLFVVPLAFVVMSLVVVIWLLLPFPLLQQGIAWALSVVLELMNFGVKSVAMLPGASLALPALNVIEAVCVAVVSIWLSIALLRRNRRGIILSSSCVLLFALLLLFRSDAENERGYMMIYNNRKNPLLHLVYEGGENYLVSTVPQLDAEYEYVSKPFIQREGLSAPQWVDWEYCDSLLHYNEGVFSFDGVTVRLLDNAYWRENESPAPVDVLILCRGFLGRINRLVKVYPAKCVVVDGSLYKRSRERIKREYSELGIDVVDISQTGAIKVAITDGKLELIPMRNK